MRTMWPTKASVCHLTTVPTSSSAHKNSSSSSPEVELHKRGGGQHSLMKVFTSLIRGWCSWRGARTDSSIDESVALFVVEHRLKIIRDA